ANPYPSTVSREFIARACSGRECRPIQEAPRQGEAEHPQSRGSRALDGNARHLHGRSRERRGRGGRLGRRYPRFPAETWNRGQPLARVTKKKAPGRGPSTASDAKVATTSRRAC